MIFFSEFSTKHIRCSYSLEAPQSLFLSENFIEYNEYDSTSKKKKKKKKKTYQTGQSHAVPPSFDERRKCLHQVAWVIQKEKKKVLKEVLIKAVS